MKFLNDSPFEGEKFQVMGRVDRFSLHQTPTGISNDNICAIFMILVEHSP